jgi:preprotein translocase subunit SecG
MNLAINLLTVVLALTSLFLVLVVLMQRAKTDGSMGAAMGGSSMESTFGADTNNVLTGATIKAAIVFFVLSFALYLAHIYQNKGDRGVDTDLPTVSLPATPAPAATTPAPQPATSTPVEPKKP